MKLTQQKIVVGSFFPRVLIVPVPWGDFMVICTAAIFLCESLQRQRVEVKGDDKDMYIFFLPLPSLTLPLYLFSTLRSFFFQSPVTTKVCTPCCMSLRVVGSCCTKFETGQTFSYVQKDATTPSNVASVCT